MDFHNQYVRGVTIGGEGIDPWRVTGIINDSGQPVQELELNPPIGLIGRRLRVGDRLAAYQCALLVRSGFGLTMT